MKFGDPSRIIQLSWISEKHIHRARKYRVKSNSKEYDPQYHP